MYEFDGKDTILNYTNRDSIRDMNKDMSRDRFMKRDREREIRFEKSSEAITSDDTKDVRRNRSVRNEEIPQKEIINEKLVKGDESIIFYIMAWLSNTVLLMFFSIFITLLVTKNAKWFYILLSAFIIVTFAQIFKIILMRYDATFLYRPGKCMGDKTITDGFLYKNFIIENILKRIDGGDYHKRGFPSIHMTIASSIITMIYLFFPKFRRMTLMAAPIYIILVGYSRIYLNCHTLLQVIAGILVGTLGGKVMYNVFI
jgi:membrane-associated phospholipid phosphatase